MFWRSRCRYWSATQPGSITAWHTGQSTSPQSPRCRCLPAYTDCTTGRRQSWLSEDSAPSSRLSSTFRRWTTRVKPRPASSRNESATQARTVRRQSTDPGQTWFHRFKTKRSLNILECLSVEILKVIPLVSVVAVWFGCYALTLINVLAL